MTYSPGIPLAGDRPSISQGQIAANFTVLNTTYGIDHNPFTVATNPGWHLKSTYLSIVPPAVDPPAVAGGGIVFTRNLGAGTTSELYYRYDTSAFPNGRIIQLSCIKAWVTFNGQVGGSPIPIITGVNVTNITRAGGAVGDYTINFASTLDNFDYVVGGNGSTGNPAGLADNRHIKVITRAATFCRIQITNDSGVPVDTPIIGISIIGS